MAQRGPKVRATAASGNKMNSNSYVAKKAQRGPIVVCSYVTSKKATKGVTDLG